MNAVQQIGIVLFNRRRISNSISITDDKIKGKIYKGVVKVSLYLIIVFFQDESF